MTLYSLNQVATLELEPISSNHWGQGTPWTDHQSIKWKHRDTQDKQPCTQTLILNLERPINLTRTFLNRGKSCGTWREPTPAQGEHTNSMQKDPRSGFEPGTLLAARQECYQLHHSAATQKMQLI
ncbi:hypothetical protein CHARACLAT_029168 [Characodon lateralis]|uniref:Uncharacterized protein n=1 Tax=Characodon lateralis TaxID=208331 RepID=A0ABU7DMK1_9TELE|nr:hypothetical protein [Characodon lateralis]